MDYKTLNLPQTGFLMKARPRGPRTATVGKNGRACALYEKIQSQRANAEKFVLHDGPPFANGEVQYRHRVEQNSQGHHRQIPKSPRQKRLGCPRSWDCQYLLVSNSRSPRKWCAGDTNLIPSSAACDAYARKFIDLQRAQFKRLGVLGDWDNPYLTLNKEYEADELRLFADIVEKGFVYRAKSRCIGASWPAPPRAEAEANTTTTSARACS